MTRVRVVLVDLHQVLHLWAVLHRADTELLLWEACHLCKGNILHHKASMLLHRANIHHLKDNTQHPTWAAPRQ